jgi:hypothetical protein
VIKVPVAGDTPGLLRRHRAKRLHYNMPKYGVHILAELHIIHSRPNEVLSGILQSSSRESTEADGVAADGIRIMDGADDVFGIAAA